MLSLEKRLKRFFKQEDFKEFKFEKRNRKMYENSKDKFRPFYTNLATS
jgi:hypothetical protein